MGRVAWRIAHLKFEFKLFIDIIKSGIYGLFMAQIIWHQAVDEWAYVHEGTRSSTSPLARTEPNLWAYGSTLNCHFRGPALQNIKTCAVRWWRRRCSTCFWIWVAKAALATICTFLACCPLNRVVKPRSFLRNWCSLIVVPRMEEILRALTKGIPNRTATTVRIKCYYYSFTTTGVVSVPDGVGPHPDLRPPHIHYYTWHLHITTQLIILNHLLILLVQVGLSKRRIASLLSLFLLFCFFWSSSLYLSRLKVPVAALGGLLPLKRGKMGTFTEVENKPTSTTLEPTPNHTLEPTEPI